MLETLEQDVGVGDQAGGDHQQDRGDEDEGDDELDLRRRPRRLLLDRAALLAAQGARLAAELVGERRAEAARALDRGAEGRDLAPRDPRAEAARGRSRPAPRRRPRRRSSAARRPAARSPSRRSRRSRRPGRGRRRRRPRAGRARPAAPRSAGGADGARARARRASGTTKPGRPAGRAPPARRACRAPPARRAGRRALPAPRSRGAAPGPAPLTRPPARACGSRRTRPAAAPPAIASIAVAAGEPSSPSRKPGWSSSAKSAPPVGIATTRSPVKRAWAVAARASSATRSRSAAPAAKRRSRRGEVAARQPLAEQRRGEGVDPGRAHPPAPGLDRRRGRGAEVELGAEPGELDRGRPVERGRGRGQRRAQRAAGGERVGDRDRDFRQRPLDRAPVAPAAAGDRPGRGAGAGDRERQAGRDPAEEPAAGDRGEGAEQGEPAALRARTARSPPARPAAAARAPPEPSRAAAGLASSASRAPSAASPPAPAPSSSAIGPGRRYPPPTSAISTTRRAPSASRSSWTTRSIPRRACSEIAVVGQADAGHQGEGLDPRDRVAGRVRVHGRERPVVAGVERGQQVERLGAADLADHDPVRAHPQRVAEQVADRHLSPALDARRPALEPHHMGLLQAQLGRVLDRHHPLLGVDEARDRVEQGGLAGAGAAADQDAAPLGDRPLEQVVLLAAERAQLDQLPAGRAAWRRSGGSRATGPSIESGGITTLTREPSASRASTIGLSSSIAAAERREDALDRVAQLLLAAEADAGRLDPAAALDVDGVGAVDHHLLDLGVGEQVLERAEADRVARGSAP